MRRLSVAAGLLICLVAMGCASTAPPNLTDTGFSKPFSGPEPFEYLAPTKATDPNQINVPIGLRRANEIARWLGLKREHVLTEEQFRDFITGRGNRAARRPQLWRTGAFKYSPTRTGAP